MPAVKALNLHRVGRHPAAGTFRTQALSPRTGGGQPRCGAARWRLALQLRLSHDLEAFALPEGNVDVVADIPLAFVVLVRLLIVLLAGLDLRVAVDLPLLEALAPAVFMKNYT